MLKTGQTINFKDSCINVKYSEGEVSSYDKVNSCFGKNCYVLKIFCVDSEVFNATEIPCSEGCEEGACLKNLACNDSDEGLNYYTKGETYGQTITPQRRYFSWLSDYCKGSVLREYYCEENLDGENKRSFSWKEYTCPNGCEEGACVQTTQQGKCIPDCNDKECGADECGSSCGSCQENQICKNYKCEDICKGCLFEEKCLPFGYRINKSYCSESKDLISQSDNKAICENNFECQSNLCINNQCVSSRLITRIIRWFKNLF